MRLTLTCDPPGGTVPDPAAACAAVRAHPDALRPIPADRACTQIWGGPARARVTGRLDGVPVAVDLDRSDGCRIDQWDRLAPLLPEPASP